MAVDSILPKPELRFLFGLTAFCGGAFMFRFVSVRSAFLFVFLWLAVWSESETINSLLSHLRPERCPGFKTARVLLSAAVGEYVN